MDLKEITPKVIWTFIILISIGVIIGVSYLIVSEILEARKECNNLSGEYNFKIVQGHFCNDRKFILYNSCLLGGGCNLIWTFEDSIGKINMSEFIK